MTKLDAVTLAGVRIDAIDEPATVALIFDELAAGRGGTVVTLNVHHLFQTASEPALLGAATRARLAVADGRPLLWAARLAGTPLPGHVAGSSLVWSLSEAAAASGRRVFLLGGPAGAADAAAAALQARWPHLVVAGTAAPFVDVGDRDALDDVARTVAAGRPDIVFSGFGAPKQELINEHLLTVLPATWFLGVGGSFSMAAGHVRRAPLWAQRAGAEWLFRLAQEPRRLARRYLVQDLPFALRLLAGAARQRRGNRGD